MRKIGSQGCSLAILVIALFAAGCTGMVGGPPGDDGADDGADDSGDDTGDDGGDDGPGGCDVPADPFAIAELTGGVGFLASDALGGRFSGTAGDDQTRAYVEEAFRCLGLVPGGTGGSYQQPFVAPDGTAAANVIGILPGSDPNLASEVIIVGGHHDHLGTMGGQIYNGANDNASGTIAVIAMARALKTRAPKRTIGFVTFGYEEHDGACEGSEYFAAHAPPALAIALVEYMVDLDMVGTYAQAGEVTVYGTTAGSRGRTILDGLAPANPDVALTHSGAAGEDDSDFQAFADRGIPYVYFETWDEACYHQPCDDAARIDYPGLARIARLGTELTAALAN